MDGIRHATMNDGWDGPESDEWATNLAILPTFDRPEHVSWANRNRPTTPPLDPWNGPIDQFIDYLTGTATAPPVVTMPSADMDPWE